jgi:hypothetical protein
VNVDYPFFGILLSPMIAGAAMSLSSASVIGNALRFARSIWKGDDNARARRWFRTFLQHDLPRLCH